jgi:hypothetical protein
VFRGNCIGQDVCIGRGMTSGFHEKCDFDSRFTCQSSCFPKTWIFMLSA